MGAGAGAAVTHYFFWGPAVDLQALSAQNASTVRLFPRLQPFKGYRLLRRLLVEARGIRRALERQADALELQAGVAPRSSVNAQVFRSFAHSDALDDKEVEERTAVSYVDAEALAVMLAKEEELRGILGRDPTAEEINRAYHGEIE